MSGGTCVTESSEAIYQNKLKNFFLTANFRSKSVEDEVEDLLKFYAYKDAIFLAELNHETEHSDNSLYLYADCLLRANHKEEAFGLLSSSKLQTAKLRYMFVKCCYDLNRIEECQSSLLDAETGSIRSELLEDSSIAPHCYMIHASILCEQTHTEDAIRACQKALEKNIMMWTAICSYLKYGGTKLDKLIDPHRKRVEDLRMPAPSRCETPMSFVSNNSLQCPLNTTPSVASSRQETPEFNAKPASTKRATRSTLATDSDRVTPAAGPTRILPTAPRKSSRLSEISKKGETRSALFTSPAIPRNPNSSKTRMPAISSDTENALSVAASTVSTRMRGGPAASTRSSAARAVPSRTSSRMSDNSKTNKSPLQRRKEIIKQPLHMRNSNLNRNLSGSSNSISSSGEDRQMDYEIIMSQCMRKDENMMSLTDLAALGDEGKEISVYSDEYKSFFNLFSQVVTIEEAICTFNWKKTSDLFANLDKQMMVNCSTIRVQLGRSCFEQAEYRECRTIFEQLHKAKPWRVEGTELLSTALWHLQEVHALSTLSQTLTSESRERAQSWCAAGNCFSLQRQHQQAVECMERALQLDKRFAYAYTLLGHELIVQEELEKASGAFRNALNISPRDYRAWYGLGLIHLRKEQNTLAQTNIQKAISINPTNRAMLCTLSNVEQQRGRHEKALKLIEKALELNKDDIACRFNRARYLFEAKRNDECLEELQKLKNNSPDEAYVFHLLARVHRRKGNSHLSLLNYSWAAELDPRGEQNISESTGGLTNREEYEDDDYGSPV